MIFRKVEDGFLIRLEKDEELVTTLMEFVKKHKVSSGFLNGLGGVLKCELGYYNLDRKKYIFRNVKDVVELVALNGNVSWIADEPVLHLHAVVSDRRNKAHGGHVKSLIVGGTCEIYLRTFKDIIERQVDPEIGLPLMQL